MIRLVNLSKSIGYHTILKSIQCEIADGGLVGIHGANGAGKTTLLRVTAGLTSFQSGMVQVGSYQFPHQTMAARHTIAYLGHQSMLYGDLTAKENFRFYLGIYRKSMAEKKIQTLLDEVGLINRQNDLVRTYSQGMQQRLQLAIIFSRDAQYIFLDEPFHSLDDPGRNYLDGMLIKANQSGKTILLVSHDTHHLHELCTRVIKIDAGRLVEEADTGISGAAQ